MIRDLITLGVVVLSTFNTVAILDTRARVVRLIQGGRR